MSRAVKEALATLRESSNASELQVPLNAISTVTGALLRSSSAPASTLPNTLKTLRHSFVPLCTHASQSALHFSKALLAFVVQQRIIPAKQGESRGKKKSGGWEDIVCAILDGVLDYHDETECAAIKAAIGSVFFDALATLFFDVAATVHPTAFSNSLRQNVYTLITYAAQDHRDNQEKLRKAIGARKLGQMIITTKDSLPLDELLNVLATIIPANKGSAKSIGRRAAFLRECFPAHPDIVALIEEDTTRDWLDKAQQIVDVLARDISFPQSFTQSTFYISGLEASHPPPDRRFILDRASFIFYCENAEDNTYETSIMNYDTIHRITVSSSGLVVIDLSVPPENSKIQLEHRSSAGNTGPRVTLEIDSARTERLRMVLENRGLGQRVEWNAQDNLRHAEHFSVLMQPARFEFDMDGRNTFELSKDKTKILTEGVDASSEPGDDLPIDGDMLLSQNAETSEGRQPPVEPPARPLSEVLAHTALSLLPSPPTLSNQPPLAAPQGQRTPSYASVLSPHARTSDSFDMLDDLSDLSELSDVEFTSKSPVRPKGRTRPTPPTFKRKSESGVATVVARTNIGTRETAKDTRAITRLVKKKKLLVEEGEGSVPPRRSPRYEAEAPPVSKARKVRGRTGKTRKTKRPLSGEAFESIVSEDGRVTSIDATLPSHTENFSAESKGPASSTAELKHDYASASTLISHTALTNVEELHNDPRAVFSAQRLGLNTELPTETHESSTCGEGAANADYKMDTSAATLAARAAEAPASPMKKAESRGRPSRACAVAASKKIAAIAKAVSGTTASTPSTQHASILESGTGLVCSLTIKDDNGSSNGLTDVARAVVATKRKRESSTETTHDPPPIKASLGPERPHTVPKTPTRSQRRIREPHAPKRPKTTKGQHVFSLASTPSASAIGRDVSPNVEPGTHPPALVTTPNMSEPRIALDVTKPREYMTRSRIIALSSEVVDESGAAKSVDASRPDESSLSIMPHAVPAASAWTANSEARHTSQEPQSTSQSEAETHIFKSASLGSKDNRLNSSVQLLSQGLGPRYHRLSGEEVQELIGTEAYLESAIAPLVAAEEKTLVGDDRVGVIADQTDKSSKALPAKSHDSSEVADARLTSTGSALTSRKPITESSEKSTLSVFSRSPKLSTGFKSNNRAPIAVADTVSSRSNATLNPKEKINRSSYETRYTDSTEINVDIREPSFDVDTWLPSASGTLTNAGAGTARDAIPKKYITFADVDPSKLDKLTRQTESPALQRSLRGNRLNPPGLHAEYRPFRPLAPLNSARLLQHSEKDEQRTAIRARRSPPEAEGDPMDRIVSILYRISDTVAKRVHKGFDGLDSYALSLRARFLNQAAGDMRAINADYVNTYDDLLGLNGAYEAFSTRKLTAIRSANVLSEECIAQVQELLHWHDRRTNAVGKHTLMALPLPASIIKRLS